MCWGHALQNGFEEVLRDLAVDRLELEASETDLS